MINKEGQLESDTADHQAGQAGAATARGVPRRQLVAQLSEASTAAPSLCEADEALLLAEPVTTDFATRIHSGMEYLAWRESGSTGFIQLVGEDGLCCERCGLGLRGKPAFKRFYTTTGARSFAEVCRRCVDALPPDG